MRLNAVFLDRDGVLNKKAKEHDYVKSIKELIVLPDIEKAIKLLKDQGFKVVVISNQRGVARGLMTEEVVHKINEEINKKLAEFNTSIDRFYSCFHDYSDNCDCRKPKPGLLLKAAKELEIDLSSSWMIGDSQSDREAALNAGLNERHIVIIDSDSSLLEAVKKIINE